MQHVKIQKGAVESEKRRKEILKSPEKKNEREAPEEMERQDPMPRTFQASKFAKESNTNRIQKKWKAD